MRYALVLYSFLAWRLNAQPVIQWQKCLGGPSTESISSIQSTEDNGFIVCGHVFDNGGDVEGVIGGGDFWIIKLDSLGNINWQQVLGGTKNDGAYSISQCFDGGYIVAGYTESNDIYVSSNHGMTDYWIVKLDKNGLVEWQKSYGGSRTDVCFAVRPVKDKGYILAGKSSSTDGDVTGNHGYLDYWVVKIDSTGEIEWQKSYGGANGAESPKCISPTKDGGYIITGESGSNNGDVSGNHGNVDIWVLKIDSIGALQWQKALGGSGLDSGAWVTETSEGGYITIGTTGSGNNGNVSGTHGGFDIWVVKLSPLGQIEWQKAFGGTSEDHGAWITETMNGNFVFCGSTLSDDGDVLGNFGSYDYWTVITDSQGNIINQSTHGGTEEENCASAVVTNDGGLAILGSTESNNGEIEGFHGVTDGWLIKVMSTNTSTSHIPINTLKLFPNPSLTSLTLSVVNDSIREVQITGISGSQVKTFFDIETGPLNVSDLPNGLYFLKAQTASGKTYFGKFIKEE